MRGGRNMERANRPNGYAVPEDNGQIPTRQERDDIRVELNDIRKEIEETFEKMMRETDAMYPPEEAPVKA
jgi:hypothetical protein